MSAFSAVMLLGVIALVFQMGRVFEQERRRFNRRLGEPSRLIERIATQARGRVTR